MTPVKPNEEAEVFPRIVRVVYRSLALRGLNEMKYLAEGELLLLLGFDEQKRYMLLTQNGQIWFRFVVSWEDV